MTLRSALGRLPAYTPGKPAAAPPGVTAYKISSNENPYPPLPSVLDAVRAAAGEMNRYPDMGVGALTEALAERLEVPPERLAFGPGSVGVLGSSSRRRVTPVTRSSSPGGRSRRTPSS